MTWTKGENKERKAYHSIKCFTCDKIIPSRAGLKDHMAHEVRYVDKDGKRDD